MSSEEKKPFLVTICMELVDVDEMEQLVLKDPQTGNLFLLVPFIPQPLTNPPLSPILEP